MELVQWALAGLIVLVLVARLGSSLRRWRPEAWAREMGLALTPRNEAFVRSYITRTRILRTVGGVAGLLMPAVYSGLVGEPIPRPFDFSPLNGLAGYLLGAVVAEIELKRPKAEVPMASLVPRDLGDYLPPILTTTLRAAAAVALALIPLWLLLPPSEAASRSIEPLPPWPAMVTMILAIAVGVELLQRYIVARPQSAVDPDLVQADDAVRSASVHALAGAGIALELLIVAVEIAAIGTTSDVSVLRGTLPWIGLACGLVSLASWIHISRPDRWRVRRMQPRTGA